MNRIEEVLGLTRVLLPVIHPIDRDAALDNIHIAHEAGCRGVFLIDQGMPADEVLELVLLGRARFPSLWIGVNLLGELPAGALRRALEACAGRIDGIWSDDAGIDEDAPAQPLGAALLEARRALEWHGLYFGGVAFKYQRRVLDEDLARAAVTAERYMDVVCTSGPGTGMAAPVNKVRILREALGPDVAVALASGVTSENVTGYLPWVDACIVGTGIEQRFGVLAPAKVNALQGIIADAAAGGARRCKSDRSRPLPFGYTARRVFPPRGT